VNLGALAIPAPDSRILGKRADPPATIASGTELRIQPLGDSITFGYQSSDGNGYRLQLQSDLSGSNLQYVGSVRAGTMADNFNEGHSGATIVQIQQFAKLSLGDRPNIILIHAGSNDLNDDPPTDPYADAPTRLGALIDSVIAACPDATILVAQLICNSNSAVQARINTFNAAIPALVATRVSAGHHVLTVDMSSVTTQYLSDGLHPNDQGYDLMGDLWFAAIQKAVSNGWIAAPVAPVSKVSTSDHCLGVPYWVPANSGSPIASGLGPIGGVRLADMDGDGKDDYIYVGSDGSLTVYLNGGQNSAAANDWLFTSTNGGQVIATGIGFAGSQILLADINGDGLADYLAVNATTGAVTCYYNGGADSTAANGWFWSDGGVIASGIGEGAGVRFADIDGDGRADYIWLSDSGAATVYINKVGEEDSNFVALNGGQPIGSGVGGARADIRFADINGDGRADYVWVNAANGSIQIWQNEVGFESTDWLGLGELASGIGTVGSDITFAHMSSGRADYIAVNPTSGALTVYLNECSYLASSAHSVVTAAIGSMSEFYSTAAHEWTNVKGWDAANVFNDIMDYDHWEGTTTYASDYGQALLDIATTPSLQSSVGSTDGYNDDQLWWCLAMLRAYENLGHSQLLSQTVTQFNQISATSLLLAADSGTTPNKGGIARTNTIPASCDVDGAVYWNQNPDSSITAISTGLYAQVAAWLLQITGDASYRVAADKSLDWLRRNVLSTSEGILTTDNIALPGCTKNPGSLTYNTGGFDNDQLAS
jgi:lysophospholipase L1-like esterase